MGDEEGLNDEAAAALIKLQEENQTLQEENYTLRHEVCNSEEKVQQLTHELTKKENLMKFYHDELEDFEGNYPGSRRCSVNNILSTLDTKSRALEREKLELTLELESRKDELEEKEAKLETLKQNYNRQLDTLKTKLAANEESIRAHEIKNAALQRDRDSLRNKLSDWQQEVTKVKERLQKREKDVDEFREREDEMIDEMEVKQFELEKIRKMYEERRDEVRRLRLLNAPRASRTRSYSASESFYRQDSLRDELEDSIRHENGHTSNPSSPGTSPFSSTFETVRSVTSAPIDIPVCGRRRAGTVSGMSWRRELESTYSIAGDSGCGDLGSDDEILLNSINPPSPDTVRRKGMGYGYPKKLEIVKPLEGSETLQRWKELATPNFTSFLEPREGIYSKHESPEPDHFFVERSHSLDDCEEDDDPEVENVEDKDEPEVIKQSLTDEFLHGVSGFGVAQNCLHTFEADPHQTPPRERSPSLVERVKKCGIKACECPTDDNPKPPKSPLQERMLSTLARFWFPATNAATRGITLPTRLGLTYYPHVPPWDRDPIDTTIITADNRTSVVTSPVTSESAGDFGLSSLFADTKRVFRTLSGTNNHDLDVNANCVPHNETTDSKVAEKQRRKQSNTSSHRRKTGKLRIKLAKKKKPEKLGGFDACQNREAVQVLHTLTSLRRQNLLTGGLPDVHMVQDSPYYDPMFLDDISLDIFSAK